MHENHPSAPAEHPPGLEPLAEALRRALDAVPRRDSARGGCESEPGPRVGPAHAAVLARIERDGALYAVVRVPFANREELTRREVEVVLGIGEGLSNREIAARLGISAATVAAHMRNIFRKLHVRTRTECARYVLAPVRPSS